MSTQYTEDDLANMSDDEIMNLSPDAIASPDAGETTEGDADTATAVEGESTEGVEQVQEEEVESNETEAKDVSDDAGEKSGASNETVQPEQSKQPSAELDYKAEYEKLFKPFKANGREISIDSVDDAITLMQMGANYNKKMAALKPNIKLLKLLESNNLLSEEKLNFLIDLDKKNPDAITKLLKDSEIHPLDLDLEKQSDYKPTVRTIDDRQLKLEETLESIQDSTHFSKVTGLVRNVWDDQSKQVVYNNPELLSILNAHMASGVYDIISNRIEKEKLFGRLQGMSDIEAYKAVGDMIQSEGGFSAIAQKQAPRTAPAPTKPSPSDAGRVDKRRAASPSASAPKVSKEPDFNPLALSDDEFMKLTAKKFY